MKKALFALCTAFLAAALAISASAASNDGLQNSTEPQVTVEETTTMEIDLDDPNCMEMAAVLSRAPQNLSLDEQVEWMRQTYLDAGFEDHSPDVTVCAQSDNVSEETRKLAYMDIEQADEELKAKILAARKKIIYSYDWRNDDYIAMRVDIAANVIEIPPKFSDLFPGWEIPVDESLIIDSIPDESNVEEETLTADNDIQPLNAPIERTYYNVPIHPNNPNHNAVPFTTVTAPRNLRSIILCWVPELPSGTTSYNVGYTDGLNGQDIAHGRNYTDRDVPIQASIPVRSYNTPVGCRRSTNSRSCNTTVKTRHTNVT